MNYYLDYEWLKEIEQSARTSITVAQCIALVCLVGGVALYLLT